MSVNGMKTGQFSVWKKAAALGSLALGVSVLPLQHAFALDDNTLPSGGNVVGGSASLDYNGNRLDIHQTTNRVVIDWNRFNIGRNDTTEFHQPHSGALAINRVTGPGQDPTKILGTLKANGNVMVLDRNGVIFGADSRVDVGGIIASTGTVDVNAVMGGNGPIEITGANRGAIIHEGTMTVHEAGLAAFVAPTISNSGIIEARLGHVVLASGEKATVDLYGDGLVELATDEPLQHAAISHSGTINAEGGTVLMTAAAAKDIVGDVINVSGIVNASSASVKGGKIVLEGANTKVSGTLDASGKTGGGEILIGGDYLGGGTTRRAEKTTVTKEAIIKANTTGTDGNGGKVIVWADKDTIFDGAIEAKGGSNSGNGGFVETSSAKHLNVGLDASVSVGSNNGLGKGGTWLIDPEDISITDAGDDGNAGTSDIATATINSTLNGGGNVTITTNAMTAGSGDITLNGANILKSTSNNDATLTLQAHRNIYMTSSTINNTSSNKLNVVFNADRDADQNGAISITNSTITTNGGYFVAGGGSGTVDSDGDGILGNGGTGADIVAAWGTTSHKSGIYLENATINTGAGGIFLRGESHNSVNTADIIGGTKGIMLENSHLITSGAGAITLYGKSNNTGTSAYGIGIFMRSGSTITSGNGDISLTGTGGNGSGQQNLGIALSAAGANRITTSSGAITVTGTQGSGGGTPSAILLASTNGGIFSSGNKAITLTALNSNIKNDTSNNFVIGGTGFSGSITLTANSIDMVSGTDIRTQGNIYIKPLTSTTSIGLGGGTGALNLNDNELNSFTAGGSLIIGDKDNGTGDVTIDSWDLSGKTHNVEIYGNDITLQDTDATAGVDYGIRLGAGNLLLHARDNGGDLGRIALNAAISKALAGHSKIDLRADENIVLTAANMIASNGGTLDIILNADRDADQNGAISITNSTITTNGGYFVAGGGTGTVNSDGDGILGNGGTGADNVAAWGNATHTAGFFLRNSHISTNGGDIAIAGHGYNNPGAEDLYGIDLNNAATISSAAGDIAIKGWGGDGYAWGWGLTLQDAGTTIRTTSGNIDIDAYGDGDSYNNDGIFFYGGGLIATDSGDIDIFAQATQNPAGWGFGIEFYGGGEIYSKTGKIDIIMPDSSLFHSFSGGKIGGADSSSDITIASKTASNFYNIETSGTTTIRAYDPGSSISISGIESDLNLADSELNTITTGKLVIGDKDNGTGDIKIDGWDISGKSYDVEVYGNDINVFGIQLGTGNLLLQARDNGLDLGRITMEAAINKALAGHSKIDLRADENIVLTNASMVASNGGSFDIILNADRNADQDGAISIAGATITTGGGYFIAGGGSGTVDSDGDGILGNGGNGADMTATYKADDNAFKLYGNSSVSTGAGQIIITAHGISQNGILFQGASLSTISGNILLRGSSTATSASSAAISTNNTTISSDTGNITLEASGSGRTYRLADNTSIYTTGTTGGDISITANGSSPVYNRIWFCNYTNCTAGNNTIIKTIAGDITLETIGGGIIENAESNTLTIGDANTRGKITISTDNLLLSSLTARTQGDIQIKAATASRAINLGGPTGGLDLNDAELAMFNTDGTLIIGDKDNGTGDVIINSWDLNGKTYDVEVYGSKISVTGGYGIQNNSNNSLTLDAKNYIDMDSAVYLSGALNLNSANNILVGNANLNAVGLTANRTVVLDGTAGSTLTLSAGTGALSLQGLVAGDRNLSLIGDEIDLHGAVSGSRDIHFTTGTARKIIEIGSTDANNTNLTAAELARLQNGFSNVYIGNGNHVLVKEAVSFSDNTTIGSTGFDTSHVLVNAKITTTDNADLTLNGNNYGGYAPGVNNGVIIDADLDVARDLNIYSYADFRILSPSTITVGRNMTVDAGNSIALDGKLYIDGNVNFTKGGSAHPTTMGATSLIDAGGNITFTTSANNAGFTMTAGSSMNAIGDISLSAGAMVLRNITANGSVNLVSAGAGNDITLGNNVTAGGSVTIDSADQIYIANAHVTGNGITAHDAITYTGTTGATFNLNAGTGILRLQSVTAGDRNLRLIGDSMTLGGNITTGSGRTLTVRPYSSNRAVIVGGNGATPGMNIDDGELAKLQSGGNLIIGRDDAGTTGTLTVNNAAFAGNVLLYGGNVAIDGLSSGGSATISAQNLIDINGDIDVTGALALNAANSITIGDADIAATGITTDQLMSYDGTAGTSRSLNAKTGTLTLYGIAAGNRNLTLLGDDMILAGTITTGNGNTLSVRPYTDSQSIVLGGGAGGLNLNDTELSYLQGSGQLNIGTQGTGTGNLTVNTAAFTRDLNLYGGNTILNGLTSTGKILVAAQGAGNDITLTGDVVSGAAGDAIILASADGFFNNSASAGNALRATHANGRWLVYSERMDQNTRGGLMPHASEFGVTYPAAAAGTGNRFLYASSVRPELTLKVNNDSVVAGSAYNPAHAGYIITGGLLASDTRNNIGLGGDLAYSTTYNAASTAASPTPYAGMIGASIGTLTSTLGYTFNPAIGAGDLTVTASAYIPPVKVPETMVKVPPLINYYSNLNKMNVSYPGAIQAVDIPNSGPDIPLDLGGMLDIQGYSNEIEPSAGNTYKDVSATIPKETLMAETNTCLVLNGKNGGCFIY